MKTEPRPIAAAAVPQWLAPADARQQLKEMIDDFVRSAARGASAPDNEHPSLALKVTAGMGKTSTMLRAIAQHADALLACGHVLVYLPTLELAERAMQDFGEIAPAVPTRVVRGREALRPGDPERKMCERSDLAKSIATFVPSVTQALCRAEDPDGNFVRSACSTGCPYLAQKDVEGAHITFLSHAYLNARPPIDADFRVALRVVDEKVWSTLSRTSVHYVEDFMRAPCRSFPENLRDMHAKAKAGIVDGLQRGLRLHDHLRSIGISQDHLSNLAKAEEKGRVPLDVGPWHSADAATFRIETFDERSFLASRRRERIFSFLSETEYGPCNRLRLVEDASSGAARQMIEMSRLKSIERDAPLLLLDADADPDITERLAPGTTFARIDAPPVADIVQVSDRTLSDSWLLDDEGGKERRSIVLKILEREVKTSAGRGVLVVATKSVLECLHLDLGHEVKDRDRDLRNHIHGATPRWYGPRTQGVNDFENFGTVVIVGRLQPPVDGIEASARAIFGGDEKVIPSHGRGPLPGVDTLRLMADGAVVDAVVRTHPDPRVHAVLAQTRECGTLQAIARLRLVSPEHAKRVVILSSVPLPGFPITRLVPFKAIERGLEHEPDITGFLRMEAALTATKGRHVRGARLSKNGLANDLPLDFSKKYSAHSFRRERSAQHTIGLCQRIAAANGWPITRLALRRKGGGKPVPAIVLAPPEAAIAQAALLWPDLTAIRA